MKTLKIIFALSLSIMCVACHSLRLSPEDKIAELEKKVIGVWARKDKDSTLSLEFITEDYRIWIDYYKNVNYKGKEPMIKGPPFKHSYKISKEGSSYFLRTKSLGNWFEIMENPFNDSIKLRGKSHGYFFSYYYKKLKDSEVLEILKDYDIDYELLKKTPIGFVDKDSFKNKELLNQLKENKIPDNSLPPIMEEYIRINNIDVTKNLGDPEFLTMPVEKKMQSSIDNFQSRKSQKEEEEIATENAIKELKEQWNFPSLEKLKADSAKVLANPKEDKKHQNSQLKGIYKRNSTILRELKPYVSEEKPIAIFTYHCYFDGHRAFAIFEDKFITFSSKLTRTKTITSQSLFSKTISNSIVEEDIIKVDVFDKNNLSKSQYSKFKDLLAYLTTNNEFLTSDSGYFSPKLNTGITCLFSTRDNDKYHSFAIDDVYGLRDDDIRYLIYSKLTALFQEVHPDSKTVKVINKKEAK